MYIKISYCIVDQFVHQFIVHKKNFFLQVFLEILPEVQPELSEECGQSPGHAPVPGIGTRNLHFTIGAVDLYVKKYRLRIRMYCLTRGHFSNIEFGLKNIQILKGLIFDG